MENLCFVLGSGGSSLGRSKVVAKKCGVRGLSMGNGEGKGQGPSGGVPVWKTGLLGVFGAALGFMGGFQHAQAGIFGSSKLKLSESEKVTTGLTTVAAGVGFVYIAYRTNREEDQIEASSIREEADRLEKWKQEFEAEEDEEGSVSNEDLMASLRDRLQKKESAPASAEDVEKLNRMFKGEEKDDSASDSAKDDEDQDDDSSDTDKN
uniref:Uncharacterized protein n=1 Tax=Rhodosorus marinus TaxID=101924 RepID=A0A7S2ZE19_9RHOD|mmetsp:Transcript_16087/g.66283  ORF Transcript_16087/g.66283 Transcript_16087/m.66283 type:complete len:207 (+) Transcript_16087:380-1000(+)